MSRRFYGEALRNLRNLGVATCAALAIAGCTAEAGTQKAGRSTIERCYDTPQPPVLEPEIAPMPDPNDEAKYDAWMAANKARETIVRPPELKLHLGSNGAFKEEVQFNPATIQQLRQGNVKILDTGHKTAGSGFATIAPDGSEVVVGPAHLLADQAIEKIKLLNYEGEMVDINGGCYILEDDGAFVSQDDGRHDVDVAILRPAKPVRATALKLAKAFPPRGTWVTFVNNQTLRTPKDPAIYSGFATTNLPNYQGATVLTGVQPQRMTSKGAEAYQLHKGGSGGLVGNESAEVVGISVAASVVMNDESLKNTTGVTFDCPVGPESGVLPVKASIMGVDIINTALASSNY